MTISALSACWALARGQEVRGLRTEWPVVFHRCVQERCSPLAWLRSSALIEADAPRDVRAKWAASVWSVQERMGAQLAALAELSRWFDAHSVPYALLKGMALSQRLYGQPWARPSDDLDVYIAPAARTIAREVFLATGWTHVLGEYPDDLVFRKVVEGHPVSADAHFSLAGPWHRQLPFPEPQVEMCTLDGVSVRAMTGPFVSVYLAAHLLQHDRRPLLWLLDFLTSVELLSVGDRERAMHDARKARLHRVFDAALRWAAEMEQVAVARDHVRDARFVNEVLRPSGPRAVAQILATSASVGDLARELARLAWPSELRPAGVVELWKRRVRKRLVR